MRTPGTDLVTATQQQSLRILDEAGVRVRVRVRVRVTELVEPVLVL